MRLYFPGRHGGQGGTTDHSLYPHPLTTMPLCVSLCVIGRFSRKELAQAQKALDIRCNELLVIIGRYDTCGGAVVHSYKPCHVLRALSCISHCTLSPLSCALYPLESASMSRLAPSTSDVGLYSCKCIIPYPVLSILDRACPIRAAPPLSPSYLTTWCHVLLCSTLSPLTPPPYAGPVVGPTVG